jgi:hypothetical protein
MAKCRKVIMEAAKEVLVPEERRKEKEWYDDKCKAVTEERAYSYNNRVSRKENS